MVSKVQVSQCVTYNTSPRNQFLALSQRREKLGIALSVALLIFVFCLFFAMFINKSVDQVDIQTAQAQAYNAQVEAQKLHDHAGE